MAKTSSGFLWTSRRVFILLAALCLAGSLFCLISPSVRKMNVIRDTGQTAVSALSPLALAISHYSADDIAALSAQPDLTDSYKSLASLLAKVRDAGGYTDLSLLFRGVGGKSFYLISAGYRDNAQSGVDYPAPGSQYAVSGYKGASSALDSALTNRAGGGYAREITQLAGGAKVLPVYIPVTRGNAVIAALAAECPAPLTPFHMVGDINLYTVGGALAGLFMGFTLLAWLFNRLAAAREVRAAKRRAAEEEELRVLEAQNRAEQLRQKAQAEERQRLEAERRDPDALAREAAEAEAYRTGAENDPPPDPPSEF